MSTFIKTLLAATLSIAALLAAPTRAWAETSASDVKYTNTNKLKTSTGRSVRTVQQALDTITGTLAHIKRNKAGAVAIRSDDVNYAGNVVIYQADNDVFGETKYPLTLTLTPNPNDSTLGTWKSSPYYAFYPFWAIDNNCPTVTDPSFANFHCGDYSGSYKVLGNRIFIYKVTTPIGRGFGGMYAYSLAGNQLSITYGSDSGADVILTQTN
jgi:hypothetical protein